MASRGEPGASLKHDFRRGEIIWVLKQDYPHLVTFRHLQLALRDRNIPLSQKDLEGYLSYLEEGGFARRQRLVCHRGLSRRLRQDAVRPHRPRRFLERLYLGRAAEGRDRGEHPGVAEGVAPAPSRLGARAQRAGGMENGVPCPASSGLQ